MIIYRAYKTELKLNNQQRVICKKHAGCARFAYNWGLKRKIDMFVKTGTSPSAIDLHKELNRLKQTKFSWMYEVSKCAAQEALRNLENAFKNFFRRIKNGQRCTFPRFKSRKKRIGSFRLTGVIRVFNDSIQLPRLGRLRLKEHGYLPPESNHVHILSATISEKAGRWFVSLQVKEEINPVKNTGPIVGVDIGIRRLATLSDGTSFNNPCPLARYERKMKRIQRALSRKQKRSRNRLKTKLTLQKLHARIANIRRNAIHQVTSKLTKSKSVIVIEDLCVQGMRMNQTLAKQVSDVGFAEFRRQLEYKTQWYSSQLVLAPRFFPSSKRCSQCGYVKTELSSCRIYTCGQCGLVIDRDINASKNLLFVAVGFTETINACYETGSDSSLEQCSLMIQEPNSEPLGSHRIRKTERIISSTVLTPEREL